MVHLREAVERLLEAESAAVRLQFSHCGSVLDRFWVSSTVSASNPLFFSFLPWSTISLRNLSEGMIPPSPAFDPAPSR